MAISVADGITRDPIGMPFLPDFGEMGKAELIFNYSIPSPAKIAADLFCKSFVEKSLELKSSLENIKKSAMFSNRKIRELNKKQNPFPDYLENDLWACVASFAVIEKNILYYGFLCDCGLAVFDKNGKLKFKTKDEGPSKIDKFIWPEIKKELSKKLNKKEHEINWRLPEARKEQRFKYRNNPREKYSYGAFTGEKNVSFYIRTGKITLKIGEAVILYTDGFANIISSEKFNVKKIKDLEFYFEKNSEKIGGAEGSLVAVFLDS